MGNLSRGRNQSPQMGLSKRREGGIDENVANRIFRVELGLELGLLIQLVLKFESI